MEARCNFYHSPEYIEKQRLAKIGDKNPNWKGGITKRKKASRINRPKMYPINKICEMCKNEYLSQRKESKYCSCECATISNKGKPRKYKKGWKLKMSKRMKSNNPMKNPINAKKMAITKTGKTIPKLKEYWKNNKNTQLKAMMSGCKNQKPNKLEKEMITIIKDLNLPYKFVGDWQVVFGGRNPDFINVNGHKKLIEVFGTYWHTTRARTFTDTEEGRIKHFKKYGFDCLVIWDTEFKNKDMLIEKLKIFEGGELS